MMTMSETSAVLKYVAEIEGYISAGSPAFLYTWRMHSIEQLYFYSQRAHVHTALPPRGSNGTQVQTALA